ncbi:MAG: AmmeMemoRadiSam system protein B [Melioribacter sp.]|uniref:AmmeMemoRadiSam system protein B n=1 Tax=Rosettibacter primus TaxID=3111523 RepID=UPI00247DC8CF|nr:AmmeMemoRadiSam system protein B [Melioribacter sp.]
MKVIINFLLLLIFVFVRSYYSQGVRPIRDNVGFCWNADEMKDFIEYLENSSDKKEFDKVNLIAGISVHDDYLYAGKVYYPLFKLINAKEVIIFGVTHGTVRREVNLPADVLILDNFDSWKGIYNDVKISPLREIIKSKLDKKYFTVNNKAHEVEHSIEALIPFLQFYNPDVKITPIMVTQMSVEKMEEVSLQLSKIIIDYIKVNKLKLGKDIFILISNDANHYGEDFNNSPYGLDLNAHQMAIENDQRIINEYLIGIVEPERIKNLAKEILPEEANQKTIPLWCGRYPVIFGLFTLNKVANNFGIKNVEGKLIKYSDTFTEKVLPLRKSSMGLTAPFSLKHWVGFFTIGFYIK